MICTASIRARFTLSRDPAEWPTKPNYDPKMTTFGTAPVIVETASPLRTRVLCLAPERTLEMALFGTAPVSIEPANPVKKHETLYRSPKPTQVMASLRKNAIKLET